MNPTFTLREMPAITKDRFPIGKPVIVESFIDSACGWEFDAPLHIFSPFHCYYEVGSNCEETVEDKIQGILFDLEFGEVQQSRNTWPYKKSYLTRLVRNLKKGTARRGISHYKTQVIVKRWSGEEHDLDVHMRTVETIT